MPAVLLGQPHSRIRMPQVAVLRDLCDVATRKAQVCEYADLWHPPRQSR